METFSEYEQARQYLSELTKFGMNFGLSRITELLKRLGHPERSLRIVHVGGTNGKGSTTAMIAAVVQAAGYRTATFTSPHLHSYTERFCINGQPIEQQKVVELINELRPVLEDMVGAGFEHPTEFEVSTALGLLYFARERVDLLVLEVGLGGAIDSTNVVVPLVSVITNVSLDHMNYLGDTVEQIARVKAGIIKPQVPVVTAARDERAYREIQERAVAMNSPLVLVGRDVTWRTESHSLTGQVFHLQGRCGAYPNLFIPLLGEHQLENAATAVAALEMLMDQYRISSEDIYKGLKGVQWPGRLEVIGTRPVMVLDGAHNHAGAVYLRRALLDYFKGQPVVMVLGMLADKERAKVVAELAPLARAVVVTRPNNPRAGDWQALAGEVRKFVPVVYTEADIGQAVQKAVALAGNTDVICITGSLYMIGEARAVVANLDKLCNS